MSWEEIIEPFEFVTPGPHALRTIEEQRRGRRMNLSWLEKHDDLCVWCNVAPLIGKRFRYCSQACVNSGLVYCNPQSPAAKGYLLRRQSWACAGCGISFEATMRRRAEVSLKHSQDDWDRFPQWQAAGPRPVNVSLGAPAYNTGDQCHVDHVIPIHQGGDGIGLDNVQVLCVICHEYKTAEERAR